MKWVRLLLGISIFWLALSVLTDGLNTLVLPERLSGLADESQRTTILGFLSFAGLGAGMLIQPLAGWFSDRTRQRWGRRGILGIGVALSLGALAIFGVAGSLASLALGYVLVQVTTSIAQAAQQGFLPDLVPPEMRGRASGLKSFMDIGGAMLGFVLLGQLLGAGKARLALGIIAGLLVLAFGLTILLVREHPTQTPLAEPENAQATSGHPLQALRLDLRRYPLFAWLVLARFLFLLGTYAVGRFLLYFVADRLGLDPASASEQAGNLLAALALATVLSAPLGGWLADRWGRIPVMAVGAVISALGVFLFIWAGSSIQILLFGGLMSLGSGLFASANWAMIADLAPKSEAARFYGLANYGTAGAAAAAGLFGPLMGAAEHFSRGSSYTLLFSGAAAAFLLSALALGRLARLPAARSGKEKRPSPISLGEGD